MKLEVFLIILKGVATSKKEIIDYIKCFLNNSINNECMADSYLEWLKTNEFISMFASKDDESQTVEHVFKATQLGYAVVASAMSPNEGLSDKFIKI